MADIPVEERPRLVFTLEGAEEFIQAVKKRITLTAEEDTTLSGIASELTSSETLDTTTNALKKLDAFLKNKLS